MKLTGILFLMLCLTARGAVYNWTNTAQWANNSPAAGDTVNLWGTFTSPVSIVWNGTAANPITFFFEPNSKFSNTTVASGPFIGIDGYSNIVINGGVNGTIQLTANGTGQSQNSVYAIDATGTQNLTVENLLISNMYNRTTNTEVPISGDDGAGILWSGSGLTVSNCTITGCQDGISGVFGFPASSNLTIVGCTVTNSNHAVALGCGSLVDPQFYNILIASNHIQLGDMFETGNGAGDLGLHRNAIYFFGPVSSVEPPPWDTNNYGYLSNVTICQNYISSGYKPLSTTAGTGAMYTGITAYNERIFNNVSVLISPLNWSGGGGMAAGYGSNVLVANNTMISWNTNGATTGSGFSVGGTNAYAYNNIILDSFGMWMTVANTTVWSGNCTTNDAGLLTNSLSGAWADYNIYNYSVANSTSAFFVAANGGYPDGPGGGIGGWNHYTNLPFYYPGGSCSGTQTFLGWFNAHTDPHGTTNVVAFSSGFTPASGSVADKAGNNLWSWGITNDYYGNPRPSTGLWTIGAVQLAFNSGNVIQIVPPGSNPSGNTFNIVPAGQNPSGNVFIIQ